MPLRAKSLEEWTKDARIFCQESLDEEDFRLLDTHPASKKVYKEIATSGKETYRRMKEMLEQPGHEADDPMIPFDLSREAMLDTLGQQMNRLYPGWLDAIREAQSFNALLADWMKSEGMR